MAEILNSIKLKDKITIATVMGVFAIVLATVVGLVTYFTADRHSHVYDYSLVMEADGSFSVRGVCNIDNCESPYYSEKIESGVKLLTAASPTCSKDGNRVYSYNYGELTLRYTEILPKSPHFYDYELITKNDILYVNGKCTAKGCEDPYLFINDVKELTLIGTIPGTCFSPKQETYSYVSATGEGTFSTLVNEPVPHTVEGVPADTLLDENGLYSFDAPGISLFPNTKIDCGGIVDGYYVCEVCREVETVKVQLPPHSFVYSEKDLIAPKFDNMGVATLVCENKGCTETVDVGLPMVVVGQNTVQKSPATELHPEIVTYVYESKEYGFKIELDFEIGQPLGHNYVYTLEFNDENGIDFVGRCSQLECQTPEIIEKNVETTFEDTSTCVTMGEWIWKYVDSKGASYSIKVNSIAYADHEYTYDMKENDKPTETTEGKVVLVCSTKDCSHEETVVLPKVEIGVNAKLISEAEMYSVYEYTYVTEHNCTVKMRILVDKK